MGGAKVRVVLIVLLLCSLVTISSAQSEVAIFFLRDQTHRQWCAFKSESEWHTAMGLVPPHVVGGIEYKDDRVAMVYVSEVDSTGDWKVYDGYTVTPDGKLDRLNRHVTIPSAGVDDEEVWAIKNGRATKQDGKPSKRTYLLDVPIVTSPQSFPFWPLSGKLVEILEKGKVCISDK